MKALVFEPSVPRYLVNTVLGRRSPLDPGSAVRLAAVPDPGLPGPDWLRVRTVLAGICGSDIGTLVYKVSPDLSGLASFPAVMGHELLGEVVEAGPAVRRAKLGDRVIVDPFLGCRVRGIDPPCASCARGFPCVCQNVTRGRFRPGLILGTCSDLPGSWSEAVVVHDSQAFRVEPGIPDRAAALCEPLGIGLHAVLLDPPAAGDKVLIVGGGPIAFAVLVALRMLGEAVDVSLVTQLEYQRRLAGELGADRAFVTGPVADDELARIAGVRYQKGILGRPYPSGGFARVYDCVGVPGTLREGLRWTREKGTFVLIGNVARVDGLDMSLVWAKELSIQGTLGYGEDEWRGERRHTFDWLMRLYGPFADRVGKLVTHTYPLTRHREAVAMALDRSGASSVKVLFEGG
jgi:threonine dehydrogenase-like Zn-dependent dehydrogenase